jgi:hypothetical protein
VLKQHHHRSSVLAEDQSPIFVSSPYASVHERYVPSPPRLHTRRNPASNNCLRFGITKVANCRWGLDTTSRIWKGRGWFLGGTLFSASRAHLACRPHLLIQGFIADLRPRSPRAALHSSLTRKLRQTSIVTLPLSLAAPTVFDIQSQLGISTQTLKTAGGRQGAVGIDLKRFIKRGGRVKDYGEGARETKAKMRRQKRKQDRPTL